MQNRALDKEIFRLAIPALGALIAEPIYVLTDTAIVGHLGTTELGGLSAASAVLLSAYSLCIFLAYGTTASVARLEGAGQSSRAANQAVQGLWLALVLGVGLALLGLAFGRQALSIFGDDPEVRSGAWIYLRVSLIGVPAMLVTLAGVGYLRGLQQVRAPLVLAGVTALANLVIEVIWIYRFDGRLGASAASTVIAQWIGAVVATRWIVRAVRAAGIPIAPRAAPIVALARVGLHLMIRTAALRGSFVLATVVAAHLGTVDLAAHEIAFAMVSLLALALDAIAIAGQSMVGKFLGQDDVELARRAANRMIGWSVGFGVVVGALLLVSRTFVVEVFSNDAAVLSLAAFLLIHVALIQPLSGAVFALDGILIGAGDQRYLAAATPIAAAVFLAAILVLWPLGAGIGWLWFALELFMAARLLSMVGRFRSGRWQVTGAGA